MTHKTFVSFSSVNYFLMYEVQSFIRIFLRMNHPVFIKILVLYCFVDQSNSSVEKAGLLGSVPMRLLPTDDKCRLRGTTLEQAIKSDTKKGLIPCYVSTVAPFSKHILEFKYCSTTKKLLQENSGDVLMKISKVRDAKLRKI
jgi:hypothetical protein